MQALLRFSLAAHIITAPFAFCEGTRAGSISGSGGPASGGISAPGPILSEAMADPAAAADARGEFLELGNPWADSLRMDSLRIAVDGKSLNLRGVAIAPGGYFLVCRDSLAASGDGMECRAGWPGLSLPNSRAIAITLEWSGGSADFTLPASRKGVSWENTWEEGEGFRRFLPSVSPWGQGDMATPGFRNGRSGRRPSLDLAIADLAWIREGAEDAGRA